MYRFLKKQHFKTFPYKAAPSSVLNNKEVVKKPEYPVASAGGLPVLDSRALEGQSNMATILINISTILAER